MAIRVGLVEKEAFEQTLEGAQCAFPAAGMSSAEAQGGVCVACLKNNKEASVVVSPKVLGAYLIVLHL